VSAGIDHVSIFGSKSLPSGWRAVTLEGLVADDGAFVDGDWVESKDQDPAGDVRLIQLADVGDGEYRNRSERFLTSQKAAELGCTFLEPGDLLVARMPDPLGRACIFPGDQKRSVTVVDVAIVRPRNPEVNARWLMYCINAPLFRRFVASLQSGSTRQRISRKNLAKIVFPLPPVDWQGEVVAEIEKQFSRLDEAVVNLKRVKANLRNLRASALNSACEGPWPSIEFGLLARDTLVGLDRGRDQQRSVGPGHRYVKMNNVSMDGEIQPEGIVYVDASSQEATRYALRSGDILFNTRNSVELVGKSALVPPELEGALYNNNLMRIRTTPEIDSAFLAMQMCTPAFRRQLEKVKRATTSVAAIYLKDLVRLPVIVPPVTEQCRIVAEVDRRLSIVRGVEAEVDANLMRAQALRQSVLACQLSVL